MNKLFITGDIHGEAVQRFSYKNAPELKNLDSSDVVFILGDCGIPFGINHPGYVINGQKKDLYELNYLLKRPEQYIFLAGNHDDRDAIEKMPRICKYGGVVRQMMVDDEIYENIVYIDTPQVLTICGQLCLCIPGAKSHDIDFIVDPEEPGWKLKRKHLRTSGAFFRTKHWDWWENEDVDIDMTYGLLTNNDNVNKHYDFIFTHDCPSIFVDQGECRYDPTDGENFLDSLRRVLNYDVWCHGHMHVDMQYPKGSIYNPITQKEYSGITDKNMFCLYRTIAEAKDLKEI